MHIPNQVPIQYVSKLQVSAAWTLNKALKCTFPVTYPPSLIQGKLRGIARDSAFLGKGTYFNDSRSDSCPQLLRHDQGTRAKERTSPPQRGPSHNIQRSCRRSQRERANGMSFYSRFVFPYIMESFSAGQSVVEQRRLVLAPAREKLWKSVLVRRLNRLFRSPQYIDQRAGSVNSDRGMSGSSLERQP